MIIIRPAKREDIPQLAEMFRKESEFHQSIVGDFRVMPDTDWRDQVKAGFGMRDTQILVAEKEGCLVGYARLSVGRRGRNPARNFIKAVLRTVARRVSRYRQSIYEPRRFGIIEDIYTEPRVRRNLAGIGYRLFSHSMEWFESQGVQEVRGVVAAGNQEVLKLAHRMGFEDARIQLRKRL